MAKAKMYKINYAIPGDPMSQKGFQKMIKKAEDGPFYTIQELKSTLDKWKSEYNLAISTNIS